MKNKAFKKMMKKIARDDTRAVYRAIEVLKDPQRLECVKNVLIKGSKIEINIGTVNGGLAL